MYGVEFICGTLVLLQKGLKYNLSPSISVPPITATLECGDTFSIDFYFIFNNSVLLGTSKF